MNEVVSGHVALELFFTVLFDRALDCGLASVGELLDYVVESFDKLGLGVVKLSFLNNK